MVRRNERIWLQSNYNLMQFSHKSKNLYNQANYIFKYQLKSNYFTPEYKMIDILQNHPAYRALPAQTAQQIIICLVKSWKSYFQALKSFKKNAKLSSIYKLQNPKGCYSGNEMDHLLDGRYKKMEDFIHKASRMFIDQCIRDKIDTIVVGYNEGWKQNIGIGKRNNQNFVNIPFNILLNKIEYKSEDVGIREIRTEESYTSKCSFLDDEEIRKHGVYKGRRVKRGLFRSANGTELNADCNAAGNIGKKVFPKTFVKGIVDTVSYPLCLKL